MQRLRCGCHMRRWGGHAGVQRPLSCGVLLSRARRPCGVQRVRRWTHVWRRARDPLLHDTLPGGLCLRRKHDHHGVRRGQVQRDCRRRIFKRVYAVCGAPRFSMRTWKRRADGGALRRRLRLRRRRGAGGALLVRDEHLPERGLGGARQYVCCDVHRRELPERALLPRGIRAPPLSAGNLEQRDGARVG